MMLLLLFPIWAQVPEVQLENTIFPQPEYTQTPNGAEVLWISDERHPISRLEMYFDQGIHGCVVEIQDAWKKEKKKRNRDLLRLGAYPQLMMYMNSAYIQIAVPVGQEKPALQLMKRMLLNLKPSRTIPQATTLGPDRSHSQVVHYLLHGSSLPVADQDCRQSYRAWLKRIKPRFLFVGQMDMRSILPMLDRLWSRPRLAKVFVSPTEEREDITHSNILNPIDLGTQGQLTRLIPIPSSIPEGVVKLYTEILGGSFTSRLSASLREEKGWVYHIEARVERTNDTRYIRIDTQFSIEEAIQIRDELERMIRSMEIITMQELRKVQNISIRVCREELFDSRYLISVLRRSETFLGSEQYEKQLQDMKKEAIEALATELVSQRSIWIVSGNKNEIEEIWPIHWFQFSSKEP